MLSLIHRSWWPAIVLALLFNCGMCQAQSANLVDFGPNGKLIYHPYTLQGETVLDFSHCGYEGGGVALPKVPVKITLAPQLGSKDDLPRLQDAVDWLSRLPLDAAGFHGALLLKHGVFRLSNTLRLTSSGVVIRGEGGNEKGTVLLGTSRENYVLISVMGAPAQVLANTSQKITSPYVPTGSYSFTVTNGAGFKPGDTIFVTRHGNAAWIHELKMDQIRLRNPKKPELTKQWRPFDLVFDRVVTQVAGSTLTLDAPLGNSIDEKWGGGSVAKYNGSARIQHVGIENLYGICDYDPSIIKVYNGSKERVDENHAGRLAAFDNVQNAWARDLGSRYLQGLASIGKGAKWVTVQDSDSVEPISLITGGRRYSFFNDGQLTLWQRCRADGSRHAFIYDSRVCGPNVFLDCEATNEHGFSEAHHRWSVGGLYDNVHGNVAVNDRQYLGSGQGWGGANYVIWNGEGALMLQSPPTAQNFAFGFVGRKAKPDFGEPGGWWEAYGQHVAPRSLYTKQLEDRLGPQAVRNIAGENLPSPMSSTQAQTPNSASILTPKQGPEPRINGSKVFGVRPGHPLVFTIPASGARPMTFSASHLPKGVSVDEKTGQISGILTKPGVYVVTLHAKNAVGTATRNLKIVVGETLALTPPMGWNHYNIYGTHITQEQVLTQAKAMAASGLIQHGWSYINIDDGWQGSRGGPSQTMQSDTVLFPDMAALCRQVHALGLKIGAYSTPWVESYGHRVGGSAMNPEGTFEPVKGKVERNKKLLPFAIGPYHFWDNDAKQFAAWGIDYLKYDWNPIEVPETQAMYQALRSSGRDVVFSLSNQAPFAGAADWAKWSNAWRTGGDIRDSWPSLKSRLFTQDRWAPYAGPGHWNDTDMMVVGVVGFGHTHPTLLTPDEQYTHMSAWCLLSVPMLLGCDLTKLDDFTLSLLTNDEVIAVSQDPLGKQATVVSQQGSAGAMAKDMEDGSKAVGLFNLGDEGTQQVIVSWADLGIKGSHIVRDLWRQKDLGVFNQEFKADVNQHGVVLVSIRPAP